MKIPVNKASLFFPGLLILLCAILHVFSPREAKAYERKYCYKLPEYARRGEIEEIRFCISSGADVNVKGERNRTALHYASSEGYKEIVELLISSGADVNAKARYRLTPLHEACRTAHEDIVDLLLDHGAGIEDRTSEKYEYYGDISSISFAAMGGDPDIVMKLIVKGANVNEENIYGETPLHFAAEKGKINVAKKLVFFGADVNAEDGDGATPLHYAAETGHGDVAEILALNGANVNESDADGLTPLGYSAIYGNGEVEKLLTGMGAETYSYKNHYGPYRLHVAVFNNDISLVERLIKNGVDVNERINWEEAGVLYASIPPELINAEDGHTPLHEAVIFNRKEIAEALIAGGANIDAHTDSGITPLGIAAERANKDIVELLLANGADIDPGRGSGPTPLILATMRGDKDIVSLLVENGADVNYIIDDVWNPLFIAISMSYDEIAGLLIDNGAYLVTCDGTIQAVKKEEIESLRGIGIVYALGKLFSGDFCKGK